MDALQGITRRRTMKTRTSMLSSLAIAALATVALNSTDALAKGAMGGSSGMHSSSAVRTTPVVVKQIKTVTTTSAVKKLNTTAVVTGKLDPKVVTGKLDPGKVVTFPGKVDPGKIITFPPGKIVDPVPPKDPPAPPAPPAPPPVVVNPPPVIVTPPAVSLGVAAAPVAAEPVGCTYEKSVRKLAGGGLQRVLIKICPDDVVVR